ncbi:glycerol-3-phosphate responsive antiterminator [Bacillus sp. AK128]
MSLLHLIGNKPIIAALRKPEYFEEALNSKVDNIFFMGGNITEIIEMVALCKEAKVGSFVHVDLVRGLSSTDKEAVSFIADYVGADGIVTPKSHLIKEANKLNLFSVLHLFAIDTLAVENGIKMVKNVEPDAVEIMPGLLHKVIEEFADQFENIPIIGSGLIHSKEEVTQSLQAGATALSVSNRDLWSLTFSEVF